MRKNSKAFFNTRVHNGIRRRILQRLLQYRQLNIREDWRIYDTLRCFLYNCALNNFAPVSVCFDDKTRVVDYFYIACGVDYMKNTVGDVTYYKDISLRGGDLSKSFWKGVYLCMKERKESLRLGTDA